ncbi:MAG: MATE family efflux transporter [Fusobacteriaceae bacterium]|jgi:putative MATE family efflux protein|nr:MATE family efflux transporter [Fusobacteriaceae bacterium]
MAVKHKFMGREKVGKLLFQFSLPAIIGMVVNALYNIVDRIYIGRMENVGHNAIAGVGIAFPVMVISFAFSVLIGLGSGNNISLSLGRKEKDLAERFLGNATALGFVVSVLIGFVIYINLGRIIPFLGASENIGAYTREYLSVICLGTPGAILSFTLNAAIRSDGNPKKAMTTQLIGAVTNIILDPIFIFAFGMGVRGAAVATIISQYVSAAWTIYYFCSPLSGIKLRTKYVRIIPAMTKRVVLIGAAPFLLQLGASCVNYVFNSSMSKYGGDLGVGAIAITQAVIMFMTMPIFGINQGLQPILGYNYGAKLYRRVREALFKGIFASVSICTFDFILIQLFSRRIILIFNNNPDLLVLASRGLRIVSIFLPIAGMQVVSSIYFQAVGKPIFSIIMSLSRQVFLLIPCIIILSRTFGLRGIWFATPAADFLATMLTATFLYREMKQLGRLQREREAAGIPADEGEEFEEGVQLDLDA